jgi:hypothetical protein
MPPIDGNNPVVRQLVETTAEQMEDGGLEPTLDEFKDFTADYPATAWLADFRAKGGTADDDQADEVEEAIMAAAKDMLD